MYLGEAIRTAVDRAIRWRGCYEISPEDDRELWVRITAAVDGTLEVVAPDQGPRRGRRRRSTRDALDPSQMRTIGFEHASGGWFLAVPPAATADGIAALERTYTGPLERRLSRRAELWFAYSGVVPGEPPPPPAAPHADHLRASTTLFGLDAGADVVAHTGIPRWPSLQYSLGEEGRVGVHVTARGGHRLEIPGFEPSPEIAIAAYAEFDREEFPQAAATILHEHLALAGSEPLFIELVSDLITDEPDE
jgi:hypothetical protein